jgi:DNA-binding NtrC family response regulator
MTSVRVLLVDDELPFVEVLARRLRKRDIDVITAPGGEQALERLKTDRVDAVILDVKMPDMDGIETLRKMKILYPRLEIIMLTGHATVESAIQGMRLGAFDYLMKPCNLEELINKVLLAKAKWEKIEA